MTQHFLHDNPSLLSHVPVTVQVLDVNDNPPEVATNEEVIVCESSRPGQVIQTVTAVDKDDFANGQRFSFALLSQLPANPNFTLKDNEDSTASIIARRRHFNHLTQELYELPIVVWDGGEPSLSGTSTLTLRVCPCQRHGKIRTCQGEAFLTSAGLSTGALIAILLCIILLLGKLGQAAGGRGCLWVNVLGAWMEEMDHRGAEMDGRV
ncbi:hypothetical protein LDENG_00216500 [Lucifuga dentata]|nr:hypothetical protein LDENG_00216500 [Lucifuga dentata]